MDLLCSYKHFSVLLLALVEANCSFIAADVAAVGQCSDYNVFKEFTNRKETGIESTGNPREQVVAE